VQGLEANRSLLNHLGRSLPGIHLKVICDRFPHFENLPVLECPWTEAGEAGELAAADIGISWLPEDEWSRGKCGLKVLQFMAAGLPVVANPVGVQTEMIEHGETGYLATTPEQWVEAIGRLAGDPALRQRMGAAGRRRVETDYSVAAGGRRWLRVLDTLCHHGRIAA
jgi:glycosyltransferase involved in cell wall biosynthesis